MTSQRIPHSAVVVASSAAAIIGYLGFSVYVVTYTDDAAMQGDVLGTWKSFAVLAFGFWLGSSSGGKMREQKGTQPVEIVNDPANPVPVTEERP